MMRPRYAQFSLIAIMLLLCAILAPFAVPPFASAQDESSIHFVAGDNELLSYEYNPDVPLTVDIANSGTDNVTVEAEIVDMGFRRDSVQGGEQVEPLSEAEVFTFPNATEVEPGHATTLRFEPKQGIQLKSGTYDGLLNVRNTTNNELIYKRLRVTVPLSYDIVGISASAPLKIDYNLLLEGKQTIDVAVENKGKQTINVEGSIVFENVVDESGEPLQINFDSAPDSATKAVEIKPGQVVFLNFKLISPTKEAKTSLKNGTYEGYVIIRAVGDLSSKYAPLILTVPSKDAPGAWSAIVDWVQGRSKWVSRNIVRKEIMIDLPFLVILIILLGLAVRTLRLRRLRCRPGPVTVEKIINTTDGKDLPDKWLEAQMRNGLEDIGLLPQGEGKPYDNVTTAVASLSTSLPPAPATWIKVVFEFLPKLIFPPTGHMVTSTLKGGAGTEQYELVFEIRDILTGNTDKIDVANGNTPEEAVKQAVAKIYHIVMIEHKQVCRRLPPWGRFATPESIILLQEGDKKKSKEYKQAALQKYQQAALEEPNNVNIRLSIVRAQQDLEQHYSLETLTSYIHLVEQWPQLLETRYRLAAYLSSFANELSQQWENSSLREEIGVEILEMSSTDELSQQWENNSTGKEKLKQELEKELKRHIGDTEGKVFGILRKKLVKRVPEFRLGQMLGDLPHNDKETRERLVKILEEGDAKKVKIVLQLLAIAEFEYLEKQLTEVTRWKEWLKTWKPFHTQPGERRYLKLWISWFWPWGKRPRFRNTVRLAKYCTMICLKPYDNYEDLKRDVERMFKPKCLPGASWQMHYNAACCYSVAMSQQWKESDIYDISDICAKPAISDICAKTAIDHLNWVIRDPDFAETDQSWLFGNEKNDKEGGDPDLRNLRGGVDNTHWKHWKSIVRPEEGNMPDEESQAKLDALRYAWGVLAVGAAAETKIWKEHVQKVKLWTEVNTGDVNTCCQDQKELWNTLMKLAYEPTENKLYEKFIEKMKDVRLPEKGISGGKQEDIEIHKKHWSIVAQHAERLSERWSKLEKRMEADMRHGTTSCSLDDVAHWADEAYKVWEALEYWAMYPLNPEAKNGFEKRATSAYLESPNPVCSD